MADDEDIAALVVDNGSGMCKGKSFTWRRVGGLCLLDNSSRERSPLEFIDPVTTRSLLSPLSSWRS